MIGVRNLFCILFRFTANLHIVKYIIFFTYEIQTTVRFRAETEGKV